MSRRRDRLLGVAIDLVVLGGVTIAPQLLGGRGRLNADTKQYLYLDPGSLLERSRHVWDAQVGGGTVTHQALGYLWPMGPYYWAADALGIPDWAAQRLWIGGIQLLAALGALALLRHLLPRQPLLLVPAALYGLSPVVLGHVTGQSALLLPFAALPWLVLVMARALREGGWRWPAVFALIVASCGSLNGSSVFFVLLAPVLWVPFAVGGLRVAPPRAGVVALARAGALTVACQLWWLAAYAVGGASNLPILALTENVQTTSYTTSAAEIVRGLGYWFFYGGDSQAPWLSSLAVPYARSIPLIAVSFAVPAVAIALGAAVRWGPRTYFALLVGIGTVVAVGAFPEPWRSPLGAAFEAASRQSDLVLSLRNTQRAAPLVILGLAGLAAAGLSALTRRHLRTGAASTLVLAVLVAGALPGQWRSGLIAERFHREEIPPEWRAAMAHLDAGSGRILELPGIDFASYRWGHTLDPVSVGLTDRPVLARELVPMGGLPGASLLGALDRSIHEGWSEPAALAPVARLLGATDILVRNDLEYERYRTVRPPIFWATVTDPAAGLGPANTFGPGAPNRADPARPMIDEVELALDPHAPPPPEVAVLPVPDGGRPILSALPTTGALVVAGDGEGLVNAAAAGLLDDVDAPVLLAADLVRPGGRLDDLLGEGSRVMLTDTNRKRAFRWYSLRENAGATEPLDHRAATDDPSDTRTPLIEGQPPDAQTTVEWQGAARVWASRYGSGFTLLAEERPVLAFDRDPSTAWRVDTFGLQGPHELGIELREPSTADHVVLLAPQGRPGSRPVTRARITLDGDRRFDVALTPEQALHPDGARVALDGRPFSTLEVRILDVAPDDGPAGFAEVAIPGVTVEEVVVLPTALTDALVGRNGDLPTSIVLTRLRADPAEPVRADPETALRRAWEQPAALDLELSGTARLSARADDATLDALLGVRPVARSSERLPGDRRARGASAVDGDMSTAWTTPFVGLRQHLEVDLGAPTDVPGLAVSLVNDARHSLPSQLLVSVDGGQTVAVDVPQPPAPGAPGDVHEVRLELPRALRGATLRVEIAAASQRTTTDWYSGEPVALPIAIAEVEVPGHEIAPPLPPDQLDSGCRDDLVTLDGAPLPVRVSGSTADALDGRGLDVVPCATATVSLAAGPHELRAVPGARTGLDLDRLVLETPGWREADDPPAPPIVEVTDSAPVSHHGIVRQHDGSPFWLILDQSVNDGWELDVEGAVVDGPRPMGSYAAAWYVDPTRDGDLAVSVRYGPQRVIDLALIVSGMAAAACLLLALWPWLRRRPAATPAPTYAPVLGVSAGRPSWLAVAAIAAVTAVAIHPLAAVPVGIAAALARRWWAVGRALPAALVAAAGAGVAAAQLRYEPELTSQWPSRFGIAHLLVLAAAILLAGLALVERHDR